MLDCCGFSPNVESGGLPIGAPDSISASAVLAQNSDRIRRFGVEHDRLY